MSAAPRLRAGTILFLAAFAVLPIVGLVPSCGTGAVGVDACRSIESARCDALVSCPKDQHGLTEDQAATCKLFYRDDCLHGIENNDAGISAEVFVTKKDACVKAIAATAACAKSGAKTMAGCAGAELVMTANAAAVSPCDMLAGSVVGNKVSVGGVELLANCNFVAAAVDGGADSSTSSSAAGGGASSSSSTSSASASSSASSASSASASSSAAGGGGGPGDASPE